jgi:FtsZ-binding cell division protein ZapB
MTIHTISLSRIEQLEAALEIALESITRLRMEVELDTCPAWMAVAVVNETADALTRLTID